MNRHVRIKLPEITLDESVPFTSQEVSTNDEKSKAKMKKYADLSRIAKKHCLKKGDMVFVAQKKKNKLSTAYEPNPYKIEEVKGSMITARRSSDGRRVTRNNSHFKRVSGGRNDQLDQDPLDFEAHECNECNDALEEKSCDVLPNAEEEPALELRRSKRTIRKPVWTRDYVLSRLCA